MLRSLICLNAAGLALAAACPVSAAVRVGNFYVETLSPTGYAAHPGARWPVLYLVPGAGADGARAIDSLHLADSPLRKDAFIVIAWEIDGGVTGMNYVTDYADGSKPLDRELVGEVIPWVESRFRVRPHRRAIAGYSAGGYSAMAVAARHPELFRAAGSFSGVVDITGRTPAGPLHVLVPGVLSGDGAALSRWGDPVTDADHWRASNPTDLAGRLRGMEAVYIAAGDGTPSSSAEAAAAAGPGAGAQMIAEAQVSEMTRSYHAALTRAGVGHVYRSHAGLHRAEHWRDDLELFWRQAMPALRR